MTMQGLNTMSATVYLDGWSILVEPEVMQELGLRGGQIITEPQFGAVLEGNLRSIERAIEQSKRPNPHYAARIGGSSLRD
jgi:hypothetical protein